MNVVVCVCFEGIGGGGGGERRSLMIEGCAVNVCVCVCFNSGPGVVVEVNVVACVLKV